MADPWAEFRVAAPAGDPWAEFRAPAGKLTDAAGASAPAARSTMQDIVGSFPGGILGGLSSAMSGSGQAAQIEMGQPVDVPSGPEGRAIMEKNVTGALPKPQGPAGRLSEAVGESLGNPASYLGPGSLPLKAALAAAGGLGSEAGGQAAEAMGASPRVQTAARLAGSVFGGGVGAKATGRVMEPAAAAIPTIEELKASAKAGYGAARNLGVEIKPSALVAKAAEVQQRLETGKGITDVTAPKTHQILDRLQSPPAGATAVTLDNYRAAQMELGAIAKEARASMVRTGEGGQEYFAASNAKRALDDYLESIPKSDVLAGDATRASDLLKSANSDYAAAKQAENITGKLDAAEVQTATTGSGSNLDNKIRQKIAPLATSKNLQYGYRPEEIEQARRTAMGTPAGNLLRKVGKLGFNDGLTMMAHTAAALPTGGMSIPIGIAGTVARKLAERMTRSQADKLEEMIRARSALAQSQMTPTTYLPPSARAAIVRALIAAPNSHEQQDAP